HAVAATGRGRDRRDRRDRSRRRLATRRYLRHRRRWRAARASRRRNRAGRRRRGDLAVTPDEYCRAIEAHLTRKNDGHLIRIVGPAFELVRGWADQGIPFKVACHGIDRSFERYYA